MACEAAMAEMEKSSEAGHDRKRPVGRPSCGKHPPRAGSGLKPGYSRPGRAPIPGFRNRRPAIIEDGDHGVSFDTDLVGPYGFCCDISRSWLAGDGLADQRTKGSLPDRAVDQIAGQLRRCLEPGVIVSANSRMNVETTTARMTCQPDMACSIMVSVCATNIRPFAMR